MIAIVDYGAGNIRSVINVLKHFNVDYCLSKNPKTLIKADGIILPGVGCFGSASDSLYSSGIADGIINAVKNHNIPLLGICLGMQLLFDKSEESAGAKGLSLLSGTVTKIDGGGRKIPHIGWTSIDGVKGTAKGDNLLSGVKSGEYFYFVHSYGCHASNNLDVAATATYGETFDVAVQSGNVFGCQFHPEKSSDAGLKIIENYLKICNEI